MGSRPHIVQVDLDLVRSAPRWLELPTPDGRVLTAELSAFEDRGDGDVMWSGRSPDALHDSVVLSIAGGGLGGHFGEPMGAKYRIGAEADGRGRMVDARPAPGQLTELSCGLGVATGDRLHEHLADLLPPGGPYLGGPRSVAGSQSHEELKILVLYTLSAERTWRDPNWHSYAGGRAATLQLAADYLAMVFRNGRLGLEPNVVFKRAPAWLDRVGTKAVSHWESDLFNRFDGSTEVAMLRRQYGADQVHLFYGHGVRVLEYGGRAQLYGTQPSRCWACRISSRMKRATTWAVPTSQVWSEHLLWRKERLRFWSRAGVTGPTTRSLMVGARMVQPPPMASFLRKVLPSQ